MRFLPLLLLFVILGCSSTRQTVVEPPQVDRIEFETSFNQQKIIDTITSVLIQNNFEISLVNERVGLIQTSYVSLGVRKSEMAEAASEGRQPSEMLLRVVIDVRSERQGGRNVVWLKGSFKERGRPIDATENVFGLYHLEQIAVEVADALEQSYTPKVTEEMYAEALETEDKTYEREVRRRYRGLFVAGAIGLVTTGVVLAIVATPQ